MNRLIFYSFFGIGFCFGVSFGLIPDFHFSLKSLKLRTRYVR